MPRARSHNPSGDPNRGTSPGAPFRKPANRGFSVNEGANRRRQAVLSSNAMAKDTEKLIRQLSLISFLMAERRPVTALEIKQEVEGYSDMNDEAFARRFYA